MAQPISSQHANPGRMDESSPANSWAGLFFSRLFSQKLTKQDKAEMDALVWTVSKNPSLDLIIRSYPLVELFKAMAEEGRGGSYAPAFKCLNDMLFNWAASGRQISPSEGDKVFRILVVFCSRSYGTLNSKGIRALISSLEALKDDTGSAFKLPPTQQDRALDRIYANLLIGKYALGEVEGPQGASTTSVDSIGITNDNAMQINFSSGLGSSDKEQHLPAIISGIAVHLGTAQGQEQYLGYLQAKIDHLYMEFGVGPGLELTQEQRQAVAGRMDGIKIWVSPILTGILDASGVAVPSFGDAVRAAFNRYGLGGLASLPFVTAVYIAIPTISFGSSSVNLRKFDCLEHELLHVASGSTGPADTERMDFITRSAMFPFLMAGEISQYAMGMADNLWPSLASNKKGGYPSSVNDVLEEVFSSLMAEGSIYDKVSYPYKVKPILDKLFSMPPKERKEMLDMLMLAYLNFADDETNGRALRFVREAVGK